MLKAVEGKNPFIQDSDALDRFLLFFQTGSAPQLAESSEERDVAIHIGNTLQAELRGAAILTAWL